MEEVTTSSLSPSAETTTSSSSSTGLPQTTALILLNHVNTLLLTLRTGPHSIMKQGTPRDLEGRTQIHPLLQNLIELRDQLTKGNVRSTLNLSEVLAPFINIITSEDVTSPVTTLALDVILKLITSGFLNESMVNGVAIMEELTNSIMHVQFELSDPTSDEITLLRVLTVFSTIVISPVGQLLSTAQTLKVLKSIFRIGRETRPTEILRQSADLAILEIISQLFRRENMDCSEIFDYFCELSDPEFLGKSLSTRLLGLNLCLSVLETVSDIKRPDLISLICDKLTRALLRNAQSGSLMIMNYVLRCMSHLLLRFGPEFKNQKMEMLTSLHYRILNPKNSNGLYSASNDAMNSQQQPPSSPMNQFSLEMIELVLENLVELCREPEFVRELYLEHDIQPGRRDLFAQLVTLLVSVLKESGETISNIHSLALTSILGIVRCLSERCGKYIPTTGSRLQKVRENKRMKNNKIALALQLNAGLKNGLANLANTFLNNTTPIAKLSADEMKQVSQSIAEFLHEYAYWLDKEIIAEIMKKDDPLCISILHSYMNQFNLRNFRIDEALRYVIWHFKLSGEGQQLERILQSFGQAYYSQNHDITRLKNADECWLLAVAILLLHTDLHNQLNRNKMTVDAWVNNTNYINEGDLDPDEQRLIYYDIQKNEFVCSASNPNGTYLSTPAWDRLIVHGSSSQDTNTDEEPLNLDIDMFQTMWSGTLLSTSIVLENAADADTLEMSIRGFLDSARIAAHYQLSQIFDNLVITLTKYSSLEMSKSGKKQQKRKHKSDRNDSYDRNNRESDNLAAKFGNDEKAQIACRTVFAITRNYGDNLREGWKDILLLIRKMFTLKLLPKQLLQLLNKEDNSYARRIESDRDDSPTIRASSSYLFGFFGNSSDDDILERQSIEKAKKCIAQCRIDDLLQSVHVLNMSSLDYLIRALCQNFTFESEDENDIDAFMWDLLAFVCVKNAEHATDSTERISVVLDHVRKLMDKSTNHDYMLIHCYKMVLRLALVLIEANKSIKVCVDMITAILKRIKDSTVAIPEVSYALLADLFAKSGTLDSEFINSVFTCLLQSRQQMPINPSYFTLLNILVNQELFATQPLHLSIVVSCISNYGVQVTDGDKEVISKIPKLIEEIHRWSHGKPEERLERPWLDAYISALQSLSILSARGCKSLRNISLSTLQRILISLVDTYPGTPGSLLLLVVHRCVFTLLDELLAALERRQSLKKRSGFFSNYEDDSMGLVQTNMDLSSLDEIQFRACHLLAKIFLHYLPMVSGLEQFVTLWNRILSYMAKYLQVGGDLLQESLPELVKNMVRVMNNNKCFKEKPYLWENVEKELGRIVPQLIHELQDEIIIHAPIDVQNGGGNDGQSTSGSN